MMFSHFSPLQRTALLALALPMLGLSVTITPAALTLPPGGTSAGTFSTTVTTGGDTYSVTGSYLDTFNATTGTISYFYDPTVKFVSSVSGFTGQADTISVNLVQAYTTGPAPVYWDSPPDYTEVVPFSLAANSSATGQACFTASSTPTTECLPELTASVSGTQSASEALGTGTAQFPYLDGTTLTLDFDTTFTFAKNTPEGASSSSPASTVPEPAQFIPAGIGLASILLLRARQLRSKNIK
jgi:hypothetical protein